MKSYLLYATSANISYLLDHLIIGHGLKLDSDPSNCIVICWGTTEPLVNPLLTLNPKHLVERADDRKQMSAIWRMNGIHDVDAAAASMAMEHKVYEFEIPVFHLQALTIFARSTNDFYLRVPFHNIASFKEVEVDMSKKWIRRIVGQAIKAVYVAGLDLAMITLIADTDWNIYIKQIQTVPSLTPRLGYLYAQAMNQYDQQLQQELNRTAPVMYGADPEFILRQPNGKIKMPAAYLEKKGKVGYDAVILRNKRAIYPLVELRPLPSDEPKRLLAHLRQTLKIASQKIIDTELQWLAGGMPANGLALGGHVHMSQIWLNSHLLRVLDNYVALPIMMMEDTVTKRRRPKYGFLGDFRRQPHGGFEYRTLPSWLVSPQITYGIFALVHVISAHYWELRQRPLDDPMIQQHYYEGNKQPLQLVISQLWQDLKPLPTYAKYEQLLNRLEKLANGQYAWNEQNDIRTAWKIQPFSRNTPLPNEI